MDYTKIWIDGVRKDKLDYFKKLILEVEGRINNSKDKTEDFMLELMLDSILERVHDIVYVQYYETRTSQALSDMEIVKLKRKNKARRINRPDRKLAVYQLNTEIWELLKIAHRVIESMNDEVMVLYNSFLMFPDEYIEDSILYME